MFYLRHDAWCEEAARLVRTSLTRGDSVVFFAPEVSRVGVARKLAELSFDTTPARSDGRYAIADAMETLAQITRDGQPDSQCIAAVVDSLERTRRDVSGPESRMTIIGQVAACLTADQHDQILGIERLWNELAGERPLLTVCGYSMELFPAGVPHMGLWPSLCAEHSAVTQVLDE
jgi:hypothetical protein